MSSGRYRLVEAEGGSLPVILDPFGFSVLAIDSRMVDGKQFNTPVFRSRAIAEIVLRALQAEDDE